MSNVFERVALANQTEPRLVDLVVELAVGEIWHSWAMLLRGIVSLAFVFDWAVRRGRF